MAARFTVYDADFIARVSHPGAKDRAIEFNYATAREVLAEKLDVMRKLQPDTYAAFPHIDALIGDLSKPPRFDKGQWTRIMYVRSQRDRFTQKLIVDVVTKILAPGLRRAAPR